MPSNFDVHSDGASSLLPLHNFEANSVADGGARRVEFAGNHDLLAVLLSGLPTSHQHVACFLAGRMNETEEEAGAIFSLLEALAVLALAVFSFAVFALSVFAFSLFKAFHHVLAFALVFAFPLHHTLLVAILIFSFLSLASLIWGGRGRWCLLSNRRNSICLCLCDHTSLIRVRDGFLNNLLLHYFFLNNLLHYGSFLYHLLLDYLLLHHF
mmetsp:Transcript_30816/g.66322  ORF Transcript_30816/g.66322 Transcript_30816/m.66322 type:complete len:211 (-) Transcript_30816:298-930(-)